MAATEQIIKIHAQAPAKPALGKPCNGCGVCCAAEPCPVSLALLWPHTAPCKALLWNDNDKRYLCGMVIEPSLFVKWCPKWMDKLASKLFKRWIAAGTLCDSEVEVDSIEWNHLTRKQLKKLGESSASRTCTNSPTTLNSIKASINFVIVLTNYFHT